MLKTLKLAGDRVTEGGDIAVGCVFGIMAGGVVSGPIYIGVCGL